MRSRFLTQLRHYRVLALESSCDDSCIALLDKRPGQPPVIIDQEKCTLNSASVGGIIPTAAHEFHQKTMAGLVQRFSERNNVSAQNPPSLICATRGPGMVGSLSAGIQLAKGLAIAWNRPFIGVHHMLGHILTAKLPKTNQPDIPPPKYPFLSLLCSGGHTMLVLSKSTDDHEIIANTVDIAAGDAIDKCARELGLVGNLLGKELEQYVDSIPSELKQEFAAIKTTRGDNKFGVKLNLPMRGTHSVKYPENVEFSFSSFLSLNQRMKKVSGGQLDEVTRQFLAFKTQQVIFRHIVDRLNVCLRKHGVVHGSSDGKFAGVADFICSGGVAANSQLREMLASDLEVDNLKNPVTFHFPDLLLCTDNAVMIGMAGIDIFENLRVHSDLSVTPTRKWSLNELLKADGWVKFSDEEHRNIINS